MPVIDTAKKYSNSLSNTLETYLKTDIKYVANGGFWVFLQSGFSLLLGFLLSIMFANLVSKEVYGSYVFVLSVAGALGAFSLSGMSMGVARAVSKAFDGTLKKAFFTKLKWSAIGSFFAFALSFVYILKNDFSLSFSLIIVGLFLPVINSSELYTSFLVGKEKFKTVSGYLMISSTLFFIVMLSTILLSPTLLSLVLVYFFIETITKFFSFLKIYFSFVKNDSTEKEAITYGKELSAIQFLELIIGKLDNILIFIFLSPVELAVYSFAIKVPEQIKNMIKPLFSIAIPKFSKRDFKDVTQNLVRKNIFLLLISLLIITAYILLAPYLYKFFFPQYVESIFYSQVFSLSLFMIVGLIDMTLLETHRRIKRLFFINITHSLLKLILLVILIYFFGILGAILARVISRIIITLLAIFLTQFEIEHFP